MFFWKQKKLSCHFSDQEEYQELNVLSVPSLLLLLLLLVDILL